MTTIYVSQGEHAVSRDANVVLQTMLGSCVSTCLYDTDRGVGGLNHMVLPNMLSGSTPFGVSPHVNDLETLINAALKAGANRRALEAKVFGGARMLGSGADIGNMNARFVFDFLQAEGIPCRSQSIGGTQARRLKFWPTSGRVQQRFVTDVPIETLSRPRAPEKPKQQEVELF